MQTLESSDNTRIVVFGTGECSKRVLAALKPGVHALAASDNDPRQWNRELNGLPVIPPTEIPGLAYDYVLVCSAWAGDIIDPLADLGIARDRILSYYKAFQTDPLRPREWQTLTQLVDMRAASVPIRHHESARALDRGQLDEHRRCEAWLRECEAHGLEGFFTERQAAVFDVLLGAQSPLGVTGNLLEIGVFHGRSAAMMLLHQQESESLLLVDARQSEAVNALVHQHQNRRVEYLVGDCRRTVTDAWLTRHAGSCRWIHIDGNHTYPFVYRDIECADLLLHDRGLLAMDDVFTAFVPEVTQALVMYLLEHPGRFELLALGDGKAYLARPHAHEEYYTALAPGFQSEVAKRGGVFKVKRDRDTRSGFRRILFWS